MLLDVDPIHHQFKHLKEIENYIQRAAKLTKQLLGFARGGKYEVKPTDINDLIETSAQMFGRTKKEITFHKNYHDRIWTVDVDRSQIDQVLLNMFVNAWQAMPTGGDLYIQTKKVKVLLSSGYSLDGQATEILNRGCDGFIQKPFKMQEMSQKLRQIITKYD